MRSLIVCALGLALGACSSTTSEPGDDDAKASICQQARDCTPSDNGCAAYPYESLPPQCVDICYEGRCCDQYDGEWHLVIYDCTRPVDAGIDAP